MKHTPGPWYAANMGNDYQGLVIDEKTGANIAVTYDKRHAPFVAAAPAMYEALSDVPLPSCNGDKAEWYARFYVWYCGARQAAIAQAEEKND